MCGVCVCVCVCVEYIYYGVKKAHVWEGGIVGTFIKCDLGVVVKSMNSNIKLIWVQVLSSGNLVKFCDSELNCITLGVLFSLYLMWVALDRIVWCDSHDIPTTFEFYEDYIRNEYKVPELIPSNYSINDCATVYFCLFFPYNFNLKIPFITFFFLSFCLSWAAPAAHGGSQARGLIGAVAAGLRQSHSNAGSEPPLRPTPQLTAMPDP